jgi:hypothetical protein
MRPQRADPIGCLIVFAALIGICFIFIWLIDLASDSMMDERFSTQLEINQ